MIEAYHLMIEQIVAATGMTHEMLHVHVGLAIYVIAQLMLGTRRGSILAILSVLIVELANEVMNRLFYGGWRWSDTLSDIVTTLFWPCALVALSKFRRHRFNVQHYRMKLRQAELRAVAARF